MFLKRVRIRDLRSIDDVEIDFTNGKGNTRARTVLLGENGCGKSTALRAIALLLAGSDALAELLKEPERWVRYKRKEARIEATLLTARDEEREVSLTLRPEWNLRETLRHNEQGLEALDSALSHSPRNYFVMGYGVTRRPAYSAKEFSQVTERGLTHARARALATMFTPEAALVSFEQWAMDLDYRGGQSTTATLRRAMAKLLPGMKFDRIDRKRRELMFRTVDGIIPFQQLSDGYQNVANWCGDMLYRITNTFQDYKSPMKTRGLLLIDELDLHLHPVWQRRLMDFLSSALPQMQIVATSHSPMIAQQLRESELYVVERPAPRKGALIRPIVGDPSQLTLPQLMSPMFGIESMDSVRVQSLRKRARTAKGSVKPALRAELAELAPLETLPRAMREQVKAVEEMTLALSKAAGIHRPRLDPVKLKARLGQKIKLQNI
jgi:predicted ATPase